MNMIEYAVYGDYGAESMAKSAEKASKSLKWKLIELWYNLKMKLILTASLVLLMNFTNAAIEGATTT